MARLSDETGGGSSKCASCVRQWRDWAWGPGPTHCSMISIQPVGGEPRVCGRPAWLWGGPLIVIRLIIKLTEKLHSLNLGAFPIIIQRPWKHSLLFLLHICFEIIFSACTSVRTVYFSRLKAEADMWIQPSSTKLRGFVKMRNHVILFTVTLNCMYICLCVWYVYTSA